MSCIIASLPVHRYCWVDRAFIRKDGTGFEKAVWFGLSSIPGRAWGLHVVLECGAIYRALPPHAIAFDTDPIGWNIGHAQMWDCYSERFEVHEYTYLSGQRMTCRVSESTFDGDYLFTVAPHGDGFSREPEQAKEFLFIELDNGRLTILPTNRVLVADTSFTEAAWPTDLTASTEVYSCE